MQRPHDDRGGTSNRIGEEFSEGTRGAIRNKPNLFDGRNMPRNATVYNTNCDAAPRPGRHPPLTRLNPPQSLLAS